MAEPEDYEFGDFGDFGDFSSAFPTPQTGEDLIATITDMEIPSSSTTFSMSTELGPLPDFDDLLPTTESDTMQAVAASSSNSFWANESTPQLQRNNQMESDWGAFSSGEVNSTLEVVNQAEQSTCGQQDDWGDFGGFQAASVGHAEPTTKQPVIEVPSVEKDDVNDVNSIRWLTVLQKSIDFALPLCKWDASHLQNCYYTSIKVDPLLTVKADAPFVTEVAQFPTIEGQSAALDLMESFGFEGAVEPSSPTDTSVGFLNTGTEQYIVGKESGPTLLDLTLPTSPSEKSQQDSFTLDADLEGLEFKMSEKEREKTSIEQLALNEKLVVNRTTWIDSELEQLGNICQGQSPPVKSNSHEMNKRVTKKSTFQEQLQELGLDTSKTSLATASAKSARELSISARLVLDRLPNVLFMLKDNIIPVQQHYYH